MKVTSAYANKLLKQLSEDKDYWVNTEQISGTYTASLNETPVIPDYDYAEVAKKIAEIDRKICSIKHAINKANVNSCVQVGDKELSVDAILVAMAQLNRRKDILDRMRKQMPQTRIDSPLYGGTKAVPEYRYINYDLDLVKKDYERINKEIMDMQMALDKHNQTFEFEIDVEQA